MKMAHMLLSILCAIALSGCAGNGLPAAESSSAAKSVPAPSPTPAASTASETLTENDTMPEVRIQVGGRDFPVIVHDNPSARAIVGEMPFTLQMEDYASQEKVTELPFALPPAQTVVPATINAGDLCLWSGNSLVLFYTTFANTFSYVPVGYIADVSGLTDALGSGGAEVTFSLKP